MVMHARKTQRMNDGYFEKHQTHPYQNSKYSSSKNYGSSSDRYDRIRDSPNGNYRSDSPDSQSPRDRDRSYQSKSYSQKVREKERENRDYKTSRDKYSDCNRSPKEKRSRESDHRSSNDRSDEKGVLHPIKSQNTSSRDRKLTHNNCVEKRDDRDRVARIGDWSEHVSSSGKKYYYNCKTEVSQWEKPREWIERERDRFRARERERERERERDRDRESDRCYSSSSSRSSGMRHEKEKHSSSRTSGSSNHKESGGGGSRDPAASSSSRHWSRGDEVDPSKDPTRSTSCKYPPEDTVQTTQDMDISPGDSTPTSELSYNSAQPPMSEPLPAPVLGPVLLANALPRLMSHPIVVTPRPETSPGPNAVLVPGPLQINAVATLPRIMSQTPSMAELQEKARQMPLTDAGTNMSVHQVPPLTVDTNHAGPIVEGPPTPTHSETPDCSKIVAVPLASPSGSVSTLQGMSSSLQALRPQGPSITPSLANHYREDLVAHVRGWPADVLEKQANRLAEEAYMTSAIQCAKVSAELKSARSIVRLTEIQATLQEQRILYLRQQIKELEELKSQNSFMSDDP